MILGVCLVSIQKATETARCCTGEWQCCESRLDSYYDTYTMKSDPEHALRFSLEIRPHKAGSHGRHKWTQDCNHIVVSDHRSVCFYVFALLL